MTKICHTCNIEKPLEEYYNTYNKDKTKKYKLNECILCTKLKEKEKRIQNIEKIRKQKLEYYYKNREKILDKNNSPIQKQIKKQKLHEYYLLHKEKLNIAGKLNYKNNRKKYLTRQKELYKQNKEKLREYKIKNKDKIRIRQAKRQKIRYKTDILFKITKTLRRRLHHYMNSNNGRISLTKKLLGCSVSFLKEYLEKQFRDGMIWENHGSIWHIDHIKPCCSFDLTNLEEQEKCFHYTNLQPLLIAENLAKISEDKKLSIHKNYSC